MTTTCKHPFEARQAWHYVAIVPRKGEALREDHPVDTDRVVVCADCGAILVPDGVLVDEPPVTYAPRPVCSKCGKPLTQPYAQELGQCIECKLYQVRNGRDLAWHEKQQQKSRTAAYHRKRRAQGLPS